MCVHACTCRWITQHGLALNCNCDLGWAQADGPSGAAPGRRSIVPCGIKDMPVGTLTDVLREVRSRGRSRDSGGEGGHGHGGQVEARDIETKEARACIVAAFEKVFGCECRVASR